MPPSTDLRVPAVATAALLVPLALLDRRMQSTGGPGIIPFELAGRERSLKVLRRWGDDGRRAAAASLVLDFPFLVAYTTLNVRATRRARTALRLRGVALPEVVGWAAEAAQLAAGACDAIENAALLVVVSRNGHGGMAHVASLAARAKFTGLLVGWLYDAAAVATAIGNRSQEQPLAR